MAKGKSYSQTKSDFFERRVSELKSENKGVDYGRVNREWSKSPERIEKLFEGVPSQDFGGDNFRHSEDL